MVFPRPSSVFALLFFSYVAASSSDPFDNQLGLAHPKTSSDQTVLYNVTDEVVVRNPFAVIVAIFYVTL